MPTPAIRRRMGTTTPDRIQHKEIWAAPVADLVQSSLVLPNGTGAIVMHKARDGTFGGFADH